MSNTNIFIFLTSLSCCVPLDDYIIAHSLKIATFFKKNIAQIMGKKFVQFFFKKRLTNFVKCGIIESSDCQR
jgi:hypothetical protein